MASSFSLASIATSVAPRSCPPPLWRLGHVTGCHVESSVASSGSAQADYHGSIPVGDNPSVAPGLHPLRGTGAPGLCVCECDVGVCSRPGRHVPRLLDSPYLRV